MHPTLPRRLGPSLHRLVAVGLNDLVTGGTVVYEAPLTIRATCTGSSSTLAGIGRCGALGLGIEGAGTGAGPCPGPKRTQHPAAGLEAGRNVPAVAWVVLASPASGSPSAALPP